MKTDGTRPSSGARSTATSVIDQGLSSLQNFLLVLLVARVGGAEEFGAFAIAYLIYTFAVQAGQALVGEPFTLLVAEFESHAAVRLRGAIGFSCLLGVLIAMPVVAVGGVLVDTSGSHIGRYLLLVGIALPALLALDGLRLVGFARMRAAVALRLDLAWIALQSLAILGWWMAGGTLTPQVLVLLWAIPGAFVGLVGVLTSCAVPTPSAVLGYWGRTRALSRRLFAEAILMNGAQYVVTLAVGLVSGVAALGVLRAAQTLFGPLNTVTSAMRVAALPLLVRSADAVRLRRNAALVSATALVVALGWTLPLLLDPFHLGERLIGSIWPLARHLILPIGLQYLALAVNLGAFLGLRTLRDTGRSGPARLRMTCLIVLGGGLGAAIDGATGAAWLFLAAVLVSVGDWCLQFRRSLEEAQSPHSSADGSDEVGLPTPSPAPALVAAPAS